MEFQPVELPNHISPAEWGRTPASIQRLVEDLLATAPRAAQSILALQAQIQREKALNRVVQAIRNSLDLDTIFATATAETAQLMAPFDCYVSQYVAEAGLWCTVAEYRHNADLPPTLGYEIPDADNPFSAQLRRLQTVRLDDTDGVADAVNQTVVETVPGEAWLLTPMVVDGQLWGSFSLVANERPFTWATDHIELAQAVAHQLEVAIQQAHLYRQVQLELEERRRVEAALEESQARLQAVAANLPGAIFRYYLRPDGSDGVLYMSPSCTRLWEVEAEAVVADATLLWQVVHPDDLPAMQASVMASAQTLTPWNFTWRITTPSGVEKWLEAKGQPVREADDTTIWDTLILDVTDRRHAQVALQTSESRFQSLADNVPGVLYGYRLRPDGSDQFTYISSGFREVYGLAPDDALTDSSIVWRVVYPEDVAPLQQSIEVSYRTLATWRVEYRVIIPSGQTKWLQGIARPAAQTNGDVIWDGLIIDISDRKQAEAALRESEARYRLLAENSNDMVCLHDLLGHCLYVSPSCTALLGYHYDEIRDQELGDFVHPDDRDRLQTQMGMAAEDGKAESVTYRLRHRQGHYRWFETLIRSITDGAGQVVQLQTTSRDVTERLLAQRQLEHDALHDGLTGLANRHQLMDRLALALGRAQANLRYQFAVLFLDLDRFKVINDSLGHQAGDQMLVAIAAKLQATLRGADLAARLGGDEFVVFIDGVEGADGVEEADGVDPNQAEIGPAAVAAAERIFAALVAPFTVADRQVYTTASIGIVVGHRGYTQAEHLLRDADIAMYRAKGNGKARYEIFTAQMHTQAMARLHLENDLRRAINGGEMVLHYQPIVTLATGAIAGFEVLTRWQHPSRGLVSPDEFIPLAEELGLISCLDSWTLGAACQQLVTWQQQFSHLGPLTMAVNLSAQDLRQPGLLADIDQVLATTGLAGAHLTLEITESMLIDDIEATIALLGQIKARGVRISIDDFGTGYSSLSYLHRLPVDYLKVDRSFVAQAPAGQPNHPIVATIMALGSQLGLDTVAEGVETPQQLEHLRSLGYTLGQGYLFSRPLPPDQITDLLTRQPPLSKARF
ncbi:MAG: two-component response regulator [Shackletoniella antarctica]|uniref:Two-component response regulator n=1 Tax=Shackletoniella antarctica TaxID=268115 RepID=A0A2W4VXA5_9CYAN|nr:MAG: two-component response regulator [Shackletoniella antarctica]